MVERHVKNGFITAFTANNFDPEIVNQTIHREVNTYLIGANAEWKATPQLTFRTDLYRSRANRPEGGLDTFLTAGLVSPTPYNQNTLTFSANPGEMPNIKVTLPDGSDYATALASGALNDQNLWSTHYDGLSGFSIKDTRYRGQARRHLFGRSRHTQSHRCGDRLFEAVEIPHGHLERLEQRLQPIQHAL